MVLGSMWTSLDTMQFRASGPMSGRMHIAARRRCQVTYRSKEIRDANDALSRPSPILGRRALIVGAAITALVMAPIFFPKLGQWIDRNLLNERLKDAKASFFSNEDWTTAAQRPDGLDASWLDSSGNNGPLYIAHALGAAGTKNANSVAAFESSRRRGFRLFEVDITLDANGNLRCHHGPEPPAPYDAKESCTLDRLLPLAEIADVWLVLDIKSDFVSTADRVLNVARQGGLAKRIIFQLYRPEEIAWFAHAAGILNLPAPILTAYMSARSLDHIASQARRIGAAALTVPLGRLPALSTFERDVRIFVHPVHDCAAWNAAKRHPITGIYAVSTLDLRRCA